ncbi:MAG: hypothetical protein C0412_19665 [Flavobacterium sp.]|nr:hypothetical protein [Flavobacterium sp.]
MNNTNSLVEFKKILLNKGEVYLRVKVRPNAVKTCVKEVMADETIKIDLSAMPVKNKANKELIKFLAQQFDTDVNNVRIISGATDRMKLVKIKDKNDK